MVNILSPIASTLKVNATFVFSNDSNFMDDVPMQFLLGIWHPSYEIVQSIVKIGKATNTSKNILKYRVVDSNRDV